MVGENRCWITLRIQPSDFSARVDTKFGNDVADMISHGEHGNSQVECDLLVGKTSPDRFGNSLLPAGESSHRVELLFHVGKP